MGPESLYSAVVSDADVARVLDARLGDNRAISLSARASRRLKPWFWPRITDASLWADSTESDGWDPRNYLRTEPRPLLQRLLETTPTGFSVLDLGCNCGSDLNILRQHGFEHLHGVDAGRAALALFQDSFPETWRVADVRHDIFQHYLQSTPSGFVDVLHSHGATIELVHPSFPVVRHMCRVTRSKIFIQISESGHSYPRRYVAEFSRAGFKLTHREEVSGGVDGQTLLEFARR